ncbi:MAG: hypothetical protein LBI38_04335 [Oscillospiraceae bacterium]|jgi:hypothetical protein|nr:hypothetical protein [Oscillospiraceae bacterium]
MKDLHKKLLVTIFAAMMFALPAATFILMPKEAMPFAEDENRFLSPFVKPTGKNLFARAENPADKPKSFMDYFDLWFADRFVMRKDWIVLNNGIQAAAGKTEINGVFTRGGRMMQVWRDYDADAVGKVLSAVNGFAERNPELSCYFILAPTSQEIYKDTLPPNAGAGNQEAFIKFCYDNMGSVTPINAYAPLYENRESYIYYRTDHHWTTFGAYLAYYAACSRMELTPFESGAFNAEHASSDFRGTLYSKTLNSKITPDVISFYTLAKFPPPNITLKINTGAEINEYGSLYFREYLDKKDKYSAFLGPNAPITDIFTDLENNEKALLIFKDSYAHSLIPFLVNHYKRITVLDMRYINTDIRYFTDLTEYDQVLFIYNAITFSEETDLIKLNAVK